MKKDESARRWRERFVGPLAIAITIVSSSCSSVKALKNGEVLRIGSVPFRVQSPEPVEGFGGVILPGNGTIRFELASGMQWSNDKRRGSGAERAEISAQRKVSFGEITRASFRMRVLSGAPTAKRSIVVAQLHGPNRPDLPPGKIFGRPVLSAMISPEGIKFSSLSGSQSTGEGSPVWLAASPLKFDHWVNYEIETKLGGHGAGYVKIWEDGRLIASHDGAVGYDVGGGKHYWKFGIYRYRGIADPSIVEFDRIEIDELGSRVFHSEAD